MGALRFLEQVKGVEPSYAAWEAAVLPMNYTCIGETIVASFFGKCNRFFRRPDTKCGTAPPTRYALPFPVSLRGTSAHTGDVAIYSSF